MQLAAAELADPARRPGRLPSHLRMRRCRHEASHLAVLERRKREIHMRAELRARSFTVGAIACEFGQHMNYGVPILSDSAVATPTAAIATQNKARTLVSRFDGKNRALPTFQCAH